MEKKKVDAAVLKLLKKVREKKEAIKTAQKRPNWLTSCTIDITGSGSINNRTNIQTVRDTYKLLEIGAFLLSHRAQMTESAMRLGLPFDDHFMGHDISHWIADLQTRVRMLKVEEQKRDLEALNKRVDKLVTPEQRREMELLELQKILDE